MLTGGHGVSKLRYEVRKQFWNLILHNLLVVVVRPYSGNFIQDDGIIYALRGRHDGGIIYALRGRHDGRIIYALR